MKYLMVFFALLMFACQTKNETQFSNKALHDTFISLQGKELTFKEIINQYKGKKVLIDVWASWCRDCIKGMPKVVGLQNNQKDVVYLFLSLDKSAEEWKAGIQKYNVQGEHFFMQSGWKGDFGSFLDLDWIPRYVVVDEQGKIALFKAVQADDARVLEALNTTIN